ncbi:MAG: NAD(P)H-dependent oxidoreductase subunit E [Spirochaetaceae bacterium]|nr:MAG: NAD(P)H-dependent oxidoreductase subunit E [Spirochaetaceae bacterium]
MPVTEETKLSAELRSFIETWRDRPGNLIMILHRVQQEYGFVPREIALALAHEIDVPLAKIYGVITFYHFFKLEKPGRNKIAVCMGTACYLKGGEDLIFELESLLGIGTNQTTDDGEFSMEAVRCVGCCGLAPVLMVNDDVYGKVTKAKLPEIIAAHRAEG